MNKINTQCPANTGCQQEYTCFINQKCNDCKYDSCYQNCRSPDSLILNVHRPDTDKGQYSSHKEASHHHPEPDQAVAKHTVQNTQYQKYSENYGIKLCKHIRTRQPFAKLGHIAENICKITHILSLLFSHLRKLPINF